MTPELLFRKRISHVTTIDVMECKQSFKTCTAREKIFLIFSRTVKIAIFAVNNETIKTHQRSVYYFILYDRNMSM